MMTIPSASIRRPIATFGGGRRGHKRRGKPMWAGTCLLAIVAFASVELMQNDVHAPSTFVKRILSLAIGGHFASSQGTYPRARQEDFDAFLDGRIVHTVSGDDTPSFWLGQLPFDDMCSLFDRLARAASALRAQPSHVQDGTRAPVLFMSTNCKQMVERRGVGTGNFLVGYYRTRFMAAVGDFDFAFQCTEDPGDANIKKYVMPWLQGVFPANEDGLQAEISDAAEAMSKNWLTPFDSSKCPEWSQIGVIGQSIQHDMRRMAVGLVGAREERHKPYEIDVNEDNEPKESAPFRDAELDDVAIHFRCGDVFGGIPIHAYGIIQFQAYAKYMKPDARSIGIITQPFDPNLNRKEDRNTLDNCRRAVEMLTDTLQKARPDAVISVRNGPDETMALVYARLSMANQTFIATSTFGAFPMLGTFGEGYFLDQRLGLGGGVIPFVRDVAQSGVMPNIHYVKGDHILATDIIMELGAEKSLAWLAKEEEEQ